MKNNEGLKFQHLLIENFKNIKVREVDINGLSFIVTGKNASGKSSLIQALSGSVDNSNIPTQAIKTGEERGSIEVVIAGVLEGKSKKYTITTYFTPAKQTGRLVVTNEAGEKVKSPATFIKDLIGNVSFDVTGFLHAKKDKKLEMLKALTGCGVEIDMINVDIGKKKAERKVRKERVESLEGSVDNHGYTPAEVSLYSEPVPVEPLNIQMAGMSKAIENYVKMEGHKKEFTDAIQKEESEISKARDEKTKSALEVERLQKLIVAEQIKITKSDADILLAQENTVKHKANLTKCEAWFSAHAKPESEALSGKITAATKHNEHHEKLKNYGNQQKEINKTKTEIAADEAEIKKLEEKRDGVISKSQLGIKGLTFTESEVFIDGLPLEEGQLNTARLFDIGVDIAIAQNPNLKVIFLHDASLFDKEGLTAIIKKAEEKNYQVIAEVVAENEDVEIKFTENDLT